MGYFLWWAYHMEDNPYLKGKGFFYWVTSTNSWGILIVFALSTIGVPLILYVWNKLKKYIFFAWFGLYLFVIFMAYASWCLSTIINPNSWWQGRLQSVDIFPLLLPISIIGLPFMFIGGVHSNPRYFWLASTLVGFFYLLEIIIYAITVLQWKGHLHQWPTLILVGIPRYLSIILGIGLNRMEAEEKNKSHNHN